VQGPVADAEPAPRHVGLRHRHGRRQPLQDDAGRVRRAWDPRRGGLGDRPGVRGPRPPRATTRSSTPSSTSSTSRAGRCSSKR
jgi:hypothetical protein